MSDSTSSRVLPVTCVPAGGLAGAEVSQATRHWAGNNGFDGQRGRLLAIPGGDGELAGYLFGTGPGEARPPLILGAAAAGLGPGRYALEGEMGDATLAALGFRLGAYRFTRYNGNESGPDLDMAPDADAGEVGRLTEAAFIARDLVNTPPNDLGPAAFEREIRAFAKARDIEVRAIVGDELLAENLPMIHAVGRASAEAPRLLDLSWGDPGAPRITLVGKGVTFDTGGLDIKSAAGMLLMKKDMGGAANILGLAHAIVAAKLNVRLRVLLPVVENAIAGGSFRPGDILPSRAGLSVEIGNTDAEGRLILADALALADEEDPQLVIDMATLTGAARVALGPELPPLYATDDALAGEMVEAGAHWGDPLWHMPLWTPYERMLDSRIADVNHVASGGFAGSITAALFLKRFVRRAAQWVHMDIYAWAPESRPGRPHGGTDQGIRASYAVLKKRYG